MIYDVLQCQNAFVLKGGKVFKGGFAEFKEDWGDRMIYTDIELVDSITLDEDQAHFIYLDSDNPNMVYVHRDIIYRAPE